jgi:hypothetical protein
LPRQGGGGAAAALGPAKIPPGHSKAPAPKVNTLLPFTKSEASIESAAARELIARWGATTDRIATNGGAFVWGLNPRLTCADRRIVQLCDI